VQPDCNKEKVKLGWFDLEVAGDRCINYLRGKSILILEGFYIFS